MKVSSSSILSLALALNGALASPLRARDYAVVTVTEVATEVVHITSTTWVDPAQYGPTELSTPPTTDSNEKHKHKSYVPTSTPSVSISETLASPTVSSSISELSVVPSSTLAYSSVETTQQSTTTPTTISTPSTSIPTTTSLPTTSLPTTTSIPTTTSELPTSIPSLLPTSTSISVPTSIQVPPTTLVTSTLPSTTSIPVPLVVPSTTAPAPVPTLANTPSGSGGGATNSGQATFYNTGLGSCGITSHDTDFICAIAAPRYDAEGTANPNNNPLCGKKINVSYNGGKPVTVTIVDRCPECVSSLVKC